MYFTYILKSEKDQKHYYGSTNSIESRLIKHNKGDVKSTRYRRPFIIHYSENFETRAEAFQREQFFKSIDGYNWLKEHKII